MQLFPVFAIHGQETRWRQRAPEVLGAGFHLGSPEGSLCFSAVLNFSVTNGINGNHPSGSSVFIQVLSRLTGASLSIVVQCRGIFISVSDGQSVSMKSF